MRDNTNGSLKGQEAFLYNLEGIKKQEGKPPGQGDGKEGLQGAFRENPQKRENLGTVLIQVLSDL